MSDILGIRGITGVTDANLYTTKLPEEGERDESDPFENFFQSALSMIKETNDWTNKVEEEEIKFELGESPNAHDLMIAQTKATLSLQYTLAVRNAVLDAYKELMNLQF